MTSRTNGHASHSNESAQPDAEQRRDRLLALLAKLEQLGARPRLALEIAGVRVLCCGADGTFVFVTESGKILGKDEHLPLVAELLTDLTKGEEEE